MRQSVLTRAFTVSLALHAGLIGLLALEAARRPIVFSGTPLQVRILGPESEGTLPPVAPPESPTRPRAGRRPVEVPRSTAQPARPQGPAVTEKVAPRPIPAPDKPPAPERPPVLEKPVAPAPAPKVTAPTLPEPAAPRPERIPEARLQAPAPAVAQRGGLSLGGPRPAAPPFPGTTGAPPSGGAARPSIREQIASLGSGLTADLGGPAKRTISLDSREEHFAEYLFRLKQRVQRVWEYPEEAMKEGISGELQIIFTLNSAGSLTYMRLVQSSGFPILDEEAIRAVKASAPFDPFLPQMGDEPLNIRGTFHYDLPRRFRRN
jgi:TonB family protein